MMLSMRSLFLKIFLWFWITVIATGIALVATWIILQPKNALSQLQTILADAAWASGTATVDELEQHGTSAASVYMQQFSQKSHLKTCLFDITGKAISGSDCSVLNDVVSPASISGEPVFSSRRGVARVFVKVQGTSGRQYIYGMAAAERHGPPSRHRSSSTSLCDGASPCLFRVSFVIFLPAISPRPFCACVRLRSTWRRAI